MSSGGWDTTSRQPYRPGKTIWWVSGNSCVSGKSMFSDNFFLTN